MFAVSVRSMVGMLQSLGPAGASELACASHVQRLLSKLPAEYVANYARYARAAQPTEHYNLVDFSLWLQGEAECQAVAAQVANLRVDTPQYPRREYSPRPKFAPSLATILHGANSKAAQGTTAVDEAKSKPRFSCSYCSVSRSFPDLLRETEGTKYRKE